MSKFSKNQKIAIEYGKGPLMVLAGPGSGKTFVITNRVKYLIEKLNVLPENILVVTFSKAAALQMQERFENIAGRKRVTWGTFHSVFFNIIRKAYGYSVNQVALEDEKVEIIREIIFDKNLIKKGEDTSNIINEILSEIALVKEDRIDLTYYYSKTCPADSFRQVFEEYEKKLGILKKIDFEDMLIMTYDLLSQREDIRCALENKYRYILVDEFQDINFLQYEVIKMIAGKDANLTIVGDDDQSIYRFRGAKPEIMLGFKNDYPKASVVILDINFRSTIQIVAAAKKLILHNKTRFEKEVKAFRGTGKNVDIIRFKSAIAENKSIVNDIKNYIKLGVNLNEIAILYRTNIQPRLLVEFLMQHNLPFVIKDNMPNLYTHWVSKDILSYLKLSLGIGKRQDLLRIINRPNRYIKREAMNFVSSLLPLYEYYKDKPFMIERIKEFERALDIISTLKPLTAIRFIRKTLGYDEFLEEFCKEQTIEIDDIFDILTELETSASNFDDINSWFVHIEEYKKMLEEKRKNKRENETEGVRLMTFHSSKGLEYEIVYIIEANNGITPHKKATSIEDMEEERRMFYVAMTRAKNRLYIYSSDSSFHKKNKLSDFVKEIMGGKK